MIDSNQNSESFYKSDYIRILFFMIGIIMLIGLPLFIKEINSGMIVTLFVILAVDFFAGITNYRRKRIMLFDALISFFGIIYFEITATTIFYSENTNNAGYFLYNELLALLFFITFYITLREYRKTPYQNYDL